VYYFSLTISDLSKPEPSTGLAEGQDFSKMGTLKGDSVILLNCTSSVNVKGHHINPGNNNKTFIFLYPHYILKKRMEWEITGTDIIRG